MTTPPPVRIAIIGAGVSGLAMAWHLSRRMPQASIHVFDAADKVGGVIQTVESPYLTELGADNFATLIPDALELVREMRLESEFISPNQDYRIAQIVRNGRLVPIPNGFSLMQPTNLRSMMLTPLLSVQGRLRALCEYFIKPRMSDEDENVESFAVRRLGRECFDRLVEPIVGGIFTARAETLSMNAAMPQFVRMEHEYGGLIRAAIKKRASKAQSEQSARQASGARYDQFTAPKLGMSWWLRKLAEHLGDRLHLSTRIESVTRAGEDQWRLNVATHHADRTSNIDSNGIAATQSLFDGVCFALPSMASAKLVKGIFRDVACRLERIPYASSAIAVLAMDRNEVRPDAFCFGAISPKIENRDCLAISLSSEKYEGRCPNDTILFRVFMGGAIRPELLERSDDHLLGLARREVETLFGPTSLPRWQSLVRWNEAMPQYMVGHNDNIAAIRQGMSLEPSLALIGNAYDGVGIPQCVRLARLEAERLASHFFKS